MNTEWKPIASAPKDGSSVLLRGKGDHRIADGYWLQAAYNGVGAWVWPYVHSEPVHWMPLPAEPCLTCNGHGMIGGLTQHSGYDAEPCPDCTPAPTSHPIPTGATGDRDWELACDECNGSGHVFVKHQVAERKTDVQEFKEECEACEGRGFNIAFEDIPGIAEYVKSCRPASTAATEGAVKRLRDAIEGECGGNWMSEKQAAAVLAHLGINAPAAGDALDAKRYRWLRDPKTDPALVLDKRTGYVPEDESVPGVGGYHTYEYRAGEELDAAIDASIAAQVPHKGGAA
ncbi:hypothetical protein [Achromobacter spanius]|uniref:DUF551 domain-containing protein n=1 Tax=Achromobacter spanius TaxID=217203 RepID=A0AAW3I5N5_9BURK|nr:hypothetical protein [Achromobacter spanius]KNE28145.1 hypothetical protein AFM18_08205 [Achromobacter spanius]